MARGYPAAALSLPQLLNGTRRGHYSFADFATAIQPRLRTDAQYLLRRWRGPVAVALEDLQQEMLLTAWTAFDAYDESRGMPIERFIRYVWLDKAKKWLHRQRNAKRRSDSAPSRLERSYTELGVETQHDLESIEPVDRMTPEEALARRQQYCQAVRELEGIAQIFPRPERRMAQVIIACAGDLEAAREEVLGDPRLMLDLRVTDTMVPGLVLKTARALEFELTDRGAA